MCPKVTSLATFSNIDLELQIAELEGQESGYRARLASLERERFTDSAAGMEIRTVEESLKSVEEQLAKKLKYQKELVLKAPRSGLVLPAETVDEKPDPSGRLSAGRAVRSQRRILVLRLPRVLCYAWSVIRIILRQS